MKIDKKLIKELVDNLSEFNFNNGGTINIKSKGECTFGADSIAESIATSTIGVASKTLLDAGVTNKLVSDSEADQKLKQEGIDPTIAMIIIFILLGLGGVGGLGGAASGGKGLVIGGILLLLIGIGLGVLLFFINTDSCEDGEDPTNKEECLKEEDEGEEEEIECICKDGSKYESRPWSDWLWLTCFIGSISCGVIGLILLLYYGLKSKSKVGLPIRARRSAFPQNYIPQN